jgi:hypothetical protein
MNPNILFNHIFTYLVLRNATMVTKGVLDTVLKARQGKKEKWLINNTRN